VGLTTQPLHKRLVGHVAEARRGIVSPKNDWLLSVLRDGAAPAIGLLELIPSADRDFAAEREHWWIERFRRTHTVFNRTKRYPDGYAPGLLIRGETT